MTQPTPRRVLGGRYRLEEILARGGMATVWIGRDELLGRRVAVKTLDEALGRNEALRGRFRQEAVAAAALSHPNIVATYDTGEDDGTAYIVLELVEGESLRQLLDRTPVLEVPQAASIAHQVARALEHAHRQGVVHRDIKPANVLVPRDGPVKVTDFGIAKAAGGDDFTRTGTVVGTARYLAPEQVQGFASDGRTDVYALGLVLYEMLAGRPAYQGDTEMATALARLTGPPTPLAELRPGISPALVSVVDQALQPDPAHRIPSAAAFDDHLQRALHGTATVPPGPAPTSPLATGPLTLPPAGSGAGRAPTSTTATQPAPAWPARKRRRVLPFLLFLLFLAALGTAAGLVTAHLVNRDGSGSSSATSPRISGVSDYDPFGDNGRESPDQAPFAIDGNPATAWNSETYATRDLGGKPGVGLVVRLASTAEVRSVRVIGAPGSSAAIYVSSTPHDALSGWGPVRGRAADLDADQTITLSAPASGQAVLVWFTRTPESGRITVDELRVA